MNGKHDLPSLIPKKIIFGEPFKASPKLSPDGEKIAYLAPVNGVRNLWLKTLSQEDDRPVTFSAKSIYACYFWSSDKYIVYFQDLSGNENWSLYRLNVETGESKELVPSNSANVVPLHYNIRYFPDEVILSINKDNPLLPDLYHLDIASGTLTMMYKNPENIAIWIMDNELKLRGIVLIKDDGIFELMVKDNNDNWKKLLDWNIEAQPVTTPLCFSKDNNYIYMIDAINYNISRLVKIDVKTGKSEVIAFNPEYDVYTVSLREERFKYDDDPVLINPHTGEIQAVTLNKFRKEWVILDKTIIEDFEVIKKLDRGDIRIVNRDNSCEMWLTGFEKDDGPVSYYIYNRKTKEGKFLFSGNPLLNDYTLSPMEEVIFLSRDGLTIHGYITYPRGMERKNLPLVLYVHGGPWFRDIWGYNPTVQWFANRGYVCLQINYRGSIGYGKDFLNGGNKEWGGKIQDDLTDGVKWAVAKGIADPRKIAIYGSGFGGYAALSGSAFTPELFSCAIALSCPGNLITFIQSIFQSTSYWPGTHKQFIKRIGDPETERELLISLSPFYNPEKIKIPLLVSYGIKNQKIKPAETYEVVRRLRSKGLHVETVVFPDEGYMIRKLENRMKLYGMAEKFLARYLGGRCEPELAEKYFHISGTGKNNFNDTYLISRVVNDGDLDSFEELMKYYEKPLQKHLFNLTGDILLSRELFQETFSRIWLYLDSYSPDMSFHSWMFKIADNVFKKHRIRENNLLREIELNEFDVDTITGGYEENIEDKISLETMINSLREPYKTSLILYFVKDLTFNEIASLMNVKPGQIKNYLFRARKALRKICMKSGDL